MNRIKNFLLLKELILVLIFSIVSIFVVGNHEPWRDEAQAWLLAKDSSTPLALLKSMGYEGSPALWHMILFPFAHAGLPFITISIIHLIINIAAVATFVKYSPFSFFQKALFIFGYFTFYEYSSIARSYVLSVLLIFLIAAFYKNRFTKPFIYSALLFLLANTNTHSLIITFILSLAYLFEFIQNNKNSLKTIKIVRLLPFLLIGIGGIVAVLQMLPASDLDARYSTWSNLVLGNIAFRVATISTGSFIPIPNPQIEFTDTLLLSRSFKLQFLISVLVLASTFFFFIKKKIPLFIYLGTTLGLFALFILKSPMGLRYYGLYFMVFIFCLWISNNYEPNNTTIKFTVPLAKYLNSLFILIITFHAIAGLMAVYYDLRYSFSAGKEAAAFLNEKYEINENILIASYRSSAASALIPYMENKDYKFYSIEQEQFYTYLVWNSAYHNGSNLTPEEVTNRLIKATNYKSYKDVILILNRNFEDNQYFTSKFEPIEKFMTTIVPDEKYYVYRLRN